MPTPAVTLKLKRFRRRFGITAPRVAIRPHFSWRWYLGAVLLLALILVLLAVWLSQRSENAVMGDEVRELRLRQQVLEADLERMRGERGTEGSALRLANSSQQQLLLRLRSLEQENAGLKEEIALFERLLPGEGQQAVVRIDRLSVQTEAHAGRYRYRLLLGFQPSKQEREFRGALQMTVLAGLAGQERAFELHAGKETTQDFSVLVRHFLRKEGGFSLPDGAVLKSVEARLLQDGKLKVRFAKRFGVQGE